MIPVSSPSSYPSITPAPFIAFDGAKAALAALPAPRFEKSSWMVHDKAPERMIIGAYPSGGVATYWDNIIFHRVGLIVQLAGGPTADDTYHLENIGDSVMVSGGAVQLIEKMPLTKKLSERKYRFTSASGLTHDVTHLQLQWGQEGLPDYKSFALAMARYEHIVEELKVKKDGAITHIHCGLGQGRSGTFILARLLVCEGPSGRSPEVLLPWMRDIRAGLVETLEQIDFAKAYAQARLTGGSFAPAVPASVASASAAAAVNLGSDEDAVAPGLETGNIVALDYMREQFFVTPYPYYGKMAYWSEMIARGVRIGVQLHYLSDINYHLMPEEPLTFKDGTTVSLTALKTHYSVVVRTYKIHTPSQPKGKHFFHLSMPWKDLSVPDSKVFSTLMKEYETILALFSTSKPLVNVHCAGGRGRSGTFVLARALVENSLGITPKQALDALRAQRPGLVETKEQGAFVLEYVTTTQTASSAVAATDGGSGGGASDE